MEIKQLRYFVEVLAVNIFLRLHWNLILLNLQLVAKSIYLKKNYKSII